MTTDERAVVDFFLRAQVDYATRVVVRACRAIETAKANFHVKAEAHNEEMKALRRNYADAQDDLDDATAEYCSRDYGI